MAGKSGHICRQICTVGDSVSDPSYSDFPGVGKHVNRQGVFCYSSCVFPKRNRHWKRKYALESHKCKRPDRIVLAAQLRFAKIRGQGGFMNMGREIQVRPNSLGIGAIRREKERERERQSNNRSFQKTISKSFYVTRILYCILLPDMGSES